MIFFNRVMFSFHVSFQVQIIYYRYIVVSIILYFHPDLGKMNNPFWRAYFFRWVGKNPPTLGCWFESHDSKNANSEGWSKPFSLRPVEAAPKKKKKQRPKWDEVTSCFGDFRSRKPARKKKRQGGTWTWTVAPPNRIHYSQRGSLVIEEIHARCLESHVYSVMELLFRKFMGFKTETTFLDVPVLFFLTFWDRV